MPFEQPTLHESSANSFNKCSWWSRQPLWVKAIATPLVIGFSGMSLLLIGLKVAPLPDESITNPTEIDSADGSRLAEWTLSGSRDERTSLQDIPIALQQATIAVEDTNFYHHHAFNLPSMARALLVNLKHGKIVEGGSTITQQLAKNLFLSQDRTIGRKVKEAFFAMQLELHESKETILNQYLNIVYYGHGAYGVGAAAELYFNKPVHDLNLSECALLAGLPKGPSIYSPLDHFAAAKHRQRLVLDRMVSAGYLSKEMADQAYRTPLQIATVHTPLNRAPYFTSTVVKEVEQRFHISPDDLYQGNTNITTTLDPLLQQAAERAIRTTLPKHSGIQAALVALDPQTGAIRAMVGGRNFDESPYNRVFAERQPGSTFKAILYTSALLHGWTPTQQVNSEMTTFDYGANGHLYTVHDYGNFYANRPLTLREAIARSDNVYAVTANIRTGPKNVIDTARKMGIQSPLQPYPAMALGVFPTSPLQMATAYATLANGGNAVSPYTVAEVREPAVNRVYTPRQQSTPVISKEVAYQMTDLLTSVLQPNGTGYAVHQYLHNLAAAKTGTTNSDAWMVGYTPNLVCAVWVGYDNNRALTLAEAHFAAPIWAKFMGTAQQHLPYTWFQPPNDLIRRTIDPVSAKLATDTCRITETDYFIKGTEPTAPCPLHPARVHIIKNPKNLWKNWLKHWLPW